MIDIMTLINSFGEEITKVEDDIFLKQKNKGIARDIFIKKNVCLIKEDDWKGEVNYLKISFDTDTERLKIHKIFKSEFEEIEKEYEYQNMIIDDY